MAAMPRSADFPEDNADSLAAWSANAAFWDEAQGDAGNFWQRELVFPPTLELLGRAERVLELACGNGNFARALAARGARVVATDASQAMLDLARSRSPDAQIDWWRVDATDADQLERIADIAGGPFDAAVCNMALMDIAAIEPLFTALPRLLERGAPFVFSVLHPAFNQGPATPLFIERRETAEGRFSERGVRVSAYLTAQRLDGVAVVGQPELQPYFHRPLEALLGAAFACGWALDGLREPSFRDNPDPGDADHFTWDDLPEIPPVLVARLRYSG